MAVVDADHGYYYRSRTDAVLFCVLVDATCQKGPNAKSASRQADEGPSEGQNNTFTDDIIRHRGVWLLYALYVCNQVRRGPSPHHVLTRLASVNNLLPLINCY